MAAPLNISASGGRPTVHSAIFKLPRSQKNAGLMDMGLYTLTAQGQDVQPVTPVAPTLGWHGDAFTQPEFSQEHPPHLGSRLSLWA